MARKKQSPSDTPAECQAMLARVHTLRDEADQIEGTLIRTALIATDGIERRAADFCGMNVNTFRRLIRPGGRHAALGDLARELRARINYRTGNPRLVGR